jgi:hypothetical protein
MHIRGACGSGAAVRVTADMHNLRMPNLENRQRTITTVQDCAHVRTSLWCRFRHSTSQLEQQHVLDLGDAAE